MTLPGRQKGMTTGFLRRKMANSFQILWTMPLEKPSLKMERNSKLVVTALRMTGENRPNPRRSCRLFPIAGFGQNLKAGRFTTSFCFLQRSTFFLILYNSTTTFYLGYSAVCWRRLRLVLIPVRSSCQVLACGRGQGAAATFAVAKLQFLC